MANIDFKKPKYIYPALALLPSLFIIYMLMDIFGGSSGTTAQAGSDGMNVELPTANAEGAGDKYTEMLRRYGREDAFEQMLDQYESNIENLPNEAQNGDDIMIESEEIDFDYSSDDEQLQSMQADLEELERSMNRTKAMMSGEEDLSMNNEEIQLAKAREELDQRLKAVEEAEARLSVEKANREAEAMAKPKLVVKSNQKGKGSFNTIAKSQDNSSNNLITAMVDETIKAMDGSRLRFKLLDDVSIDGVELKKGTYLYGSVSGFAAQRVMVSINNVLVGDVFLKINLSVYDNDGMEGFYVPASEFREFAKDAAASTTSQSININSNGGALNAETLGMQALQNVYNSASNALSRHIRRNKAKIKYNTIVYLINK